MNTAAPANLRMETEEELLAYLDRCSEEMRMIFARMDVRAEQSARTHAQIDATLDRIEERLRHVQASR